MAYADFLNACSFFVMMIFVEIASNIVDSFLHGFHFPHWWPFKVKVIKPLFTSFKLPIIVVKILFGFLYQYIFPQLYSHWSFLWSTRNRTMILSIILLRAGLELDFKGKHIQAIICGSVPVLCEVFIVSAIGYGAFGYQYPFAVSLGFLVGSGSPGICVPILLNFKNRGMGMDNSLINIMLAALPIDEIVAIIGLGAAQTIAFNGIIKNQQTSQEIALHFIYEILASIGVGIFAGLLMYPLKNFSNKIKVIPLITFAIGIIFAFEKANFYESKFLASLIFGATTSKVWNRNNPDKELTHLWKYCSPALFGSIGADLVIAKINSSVLGYTFLTIFVGLAAKFLSMMTLGFLFFRKIWMKGEILFAASCWLAKAAFQASLGSSFITLANSNNVPEYLPIGYDILTISILYIIVAGPMGSILAITFGNKYLTPTKNKEEDPKDHRPLIFDDINLPEDFQHQSTNRNEKDINENLQTNDVILELQNKKPNQREEFPKNNLNTAIFPSEETSENLIKRKVLEDPDDVNEEDTHSIKKK